MGLTALIGAGSATGAPPGSSKKVEAPAAPASAPATYPVPLLPGRYVGDAPDTAETTLKVERQGQATLSLQPDKVFAAKDLQVSAGPSGPCIVGLGPAATCWKMVAGAGPAPRPTTRPSTWCGTWTHQAPGGSVTLKLDAEGNFALEQSGPPGSATAQNPPATNQSTGTWHAEADALVIAPTGGGPPLRYRVQIDAGALNLSGGDLAFEVRFEPVATDRPATP